MCYEVGMAASASSFPQLRVNQVSGAIISCAMHVHSVLGPGLLESAYQDCLVHELRKRGLDVASQTGLPVVFDGEKIELGYRIDLIVENLVIVEVTSVEAIHPPGSSSSAFVVHAAERDRVGLLINFYVLHLRNGIKRMVDGKNWERQVYPVFPLRPPC
jgi:GxxExxY protein